VRRAKLVDRGFAANLSYLKIPVTPFRLHRQLPELLHRSATGLLERAAEGGASACLTWHGSVSDQEFFLDECKQCLDSRWPPHPESPSETQQEDWFHAVGSAVRKRSPASGSPWWEQSRPPRPTGCGWIDRGYKKWPFPRVTKRSKLQTLSRAYRLNVRFLSRRWEGEPISMNMRTFFEHGMLPSMS